MKFFFFIFVTHFILASHAFGMDMSGKWQGVCYFNGEEAPMELDIKNDIDSISIDGDIFSLNSTTSRNHSGTDAGQEWKEVTVYDWQWNEDKTIINTNARWLGWFVSQNGTWSGKGTGHIKMNGSNLETTRTFEIDYNGKIEKNEELCNYTLKE
jgi:hypothetical protein